jgi:hypothetical protein
MMVPVIKFNESKASAELLKEKFHPLRDLFVSKGYQVLSLTWKLKITGSDVVCLCKQFLGSVPYSKRT